MNNLLFKEEGKEEAREEEEGLFKADAVNEEDPSEEGTGGRERPGEKGGLGHVLKDTTVTQ